MSDRSGASPRAARLPALPDQPESEPALRYAVPVPPECLPPVPPRDLLTAWDAARAGAAAQRWGPARVLSFPRPDGDTTEISIADRDARCWAEAVDRLAGLDSVPGLALCLRLLALVEVMTRATWLAGLFDITPGGIELHPALLRAAAELPLDSAARFDDATLRRSLARPITGRSGPAPSSPAGVSA